MTVVKDEWMHWEEVLQKLGRPWERQDNYLVKLNEHGVPVYMVRIYDGSEHELARKDHVITNIGIFQEYFQ